MKCSFNEDELEILGENFPRLKEICEISGSGRRNTSGITLNYDDNKFYFIDGYSIDDLPDEIEELSSKIAKEINPDAIYGECDFCDDEINDKIGEKLPEIFKPKFQCYSFSVGHFDPVGWIGYYWPLKDVINELGDDDFKCANWVQEFI